MFKNTSNLYDSEWLAIVFNNRNKNYGAYELRAHASQRLLRAFLITVPLFVCFFVAPIIYAHFTKLPAIAQVNVVMQTQNLAPILELKPAEPKKEVPQKEAIKPISAVKTVKYTNNIKVVEHTAAEAPTTAQVNQAVLANVSSEGAAATGNALSTTNATGGNAEGNGTANEHTVFNTGSVEVYPEFPGGMAAWAKFIQKNLHYPYLAQEQEVQGKVYISFVVEKDGSITDVNVVKGIGAGCDEEAVRVIKKSPRWKPGLQSNQAVRVRYQMPINYSIQ